MVSLKELNYILCHWKSLLTSKEEFQQQLLKKLYTGLKALSPDEYTLLYKKYFINGKPISDHDLSLEYGLKPKEVNKLVASAKNNAQNAMNEKEGRN